MLGLLKSFMKEEDGLGTVEMVVLIAVLVGIALIFRKAIFAFVKTVISRIFTTGDAAADQSDASSYAAPAMKS